MGWVCEGGGGGGGYPLRNQKKPTYNAQNAIVRPYVALSCIEMHVGILNPLHNTIEGGSSAR